MKYIPICYPTLLRSVQITRETSTNITRYLYSTRLIPTSRVKVNKLGKLESWEKKSLDNKPLIGRFECSIAENFYSLFVFSLALPARQSTAQLVKIPSDTTHQNV